MKSILFFIAIILLNLCSATDPFSFLRSYYGQMVAPKKVEEKKPDLSLTSKGVTPSCYSAREYAYGTGMQTAEAFCGTGYQVLSGYCQVYGKGEVSNQYSISNTTDGESYYHCQSLGSSFNRYTLSARAWCCKFV